MNKWIVGPAFGLACGLVVTVVQHDWTGTVLTAFAAAIFAIIGSQWHRIVAKIKGV